MSGIERPAKTFLVLPGMKPRYTTDPRRAGETRLPGCGWLPNRIRCTLISMLGEFVGTFLFLFFAFAGTQVANTVPSRAGSPPNVATLLYISLAFGFSLAVNVWVFFRISGGLFNPAVTVALALAGSINWLKAILLIISQVIAGVAAAGVVAALFPEDFNVRTTLNPDTSIIRGLFIEMFLTAGLIFTIFMLAAEKHKATFLAPIGIGLSLFVAELAGVFFTGGSLNPARSFGPDLILLTFDGYHWLYWVGPLLGAIVAVIFYRFIKLLEYETANPGADNDGRDVLREPSGPALAEDDHHVNRPTDGTDDSQSSPPVQQPTKTVTEAYTAGSTQSEDVAYRPAKPNPTFSHGLDGHNSDTSSSENIDHPNERPRAQHRPASLSSRSRSRSHYTEQDSESSYHNGPSLESGGSGSTSNSSGRGRSRSRQ